MNETCAKCGNMLPEGAEVCPSCGQPVVPETAAEAPVTAEEPVTAETPETEAPAETAEALSEEAPVLETSGEEIPAEAPEVELELQPEPRQRPKAQSRKGGRRNHMKRSSAAVVGVLIGLIVALVVVGAGILVLMRQLGFFAPMSDEELLAVNLPEPTATVAPVPEPEPSQEPEAQEEAEPEPSQEPEAQEEAEPEPTPDPAAELESFVLTDDSTIYLFSRGMTAPVPYELQPETLQSLIEWTSDDETVAVVEDGVVQGRRGGSCNISGTIGNTTISVEVVCDFEVPTTVLDMNMEDITMTYEGQTVELAIDYELDDAVEQAIVWESSDPDVATVSDKGVVTAVSDGTAVITAALEDYTASCIVRCVDVTGNHGYNSSQSEYVINYEDVTLTRKGEYFQLSLTSVVGGEVPRFTWSSDDNAVATVDSKGIVTAVADGVANITATVGGDDFRCIVRVAIS